MEQQIEKEYKELDEWRWASSLDLEELEMQLSNYGWVEAIDGCRVEADGTCPHGYRSPLLVLGVI